MTSTQQTALAFTRAALAIVYVWFGLLKLLDSSPANPLVAALLAKTLPFVTFDQFIILLGLVEIVIGLAFLSPRTQKLALALLIPHLITTTMPLLLLPAVTWQKILTPTLEGQYIIKNLLIISAAFILYVFSPLPRADRASR